MSLSNSIEKIIDLLKDPGCQRMNTSNLKGYLGELLVFQKLEEEGYKVTHLGNQSGYDLEISELAKIDVKYSKFNEDFDDWGWALVPYSKKRAISCSHFVCLAMNGDYTVNSYFVIKKKDYEKFPSTIGRFRLKHSFSAVKDGFSYERHLPNPYLEECTRLLQDGTVTRIHSSGSLYDILKL